MRNYSIEVDKVKNPIYKADLAMGGNDDKGNRFGLNNYYLTINDEPFFGVGGEAHFARICRDNWEDEIIKMRLGGINILSTYIFWNYHEEIMGEFDWSGNKDLHKFLELCKKNDMFVILRIGPFSHGECRNGGFPDWIYGQPFDIRCDNEEYLFYTRRFYHQIFQQAKGLLYKDGGPVIGIQLENEHEHASCPWEMTTENSKEWIVSGRNGKEHMATLKRIAIEEGFDVPLYTGTAWGGSCAPEDVVLPLWGGYAFRPWMFYGDIKEHPATAEYLYGDFHNNDAPDYYNFDPVYPAENLPYACCEMGGGMNVYYPYRFQLPYESVGALAQVKAGSGCNFLGYYMYHGGTHAKGKLTPYMNECALPKFSYDYQAAIGEFGQIRKSYRQLKLQHIFYTKFAKEFVATKTYLSKEAVTQQPEDTDTLRYVIRAAENGSGFLFINNYQDHANTHDQKDFSVSVNIGGEQIRIPSEGSLNLKKDEYAILPFHFDMGNVRLTYATTQLITKQEYKEETYYFFAKVPKMRAEYCFDEEIDIKGEGVNSKQNIVSVEAETETVTFTVEKEGKKIHICTLTVEDALNFWQIPIDGEEKIVISDFAVLVKDGKLELEYEYNRDIEMKLFPADKEQIIIGGETVNAERKDIFCCYHKEAQKRIFEVEWQDCSSVNSQSDGMLKRPVVGSPLTSTKIVNARAKIRIPKEAFEDVKRLILKVKYVGDVGYAFCRGEMFHDNFCNGLPWEIDLMPMKDKILENGMYIYISPQRKGAYVDSSSAMAARFEVAKEQIAELEDITADGVKSVEIEW